MAAVLPAYAIEPRHVVVVVWDGMRPDFVTEEKTPTLWKLAQGGVTFSNHHPVYPSATNVNGTALATGVYPGHSGIIANHVYRPDIEPGKAIDIEEVNAVRKGDELSNGKYVAVPTIAELIHQAGGRTVIATAKTIGLLLDRHVDPAAKDSVTLFSGKSLPESIAGPLWKKFGPFPDPKRHEFAKWDNWTTRALTESLWKTDIPVFSVLWLSEPDGSQHGDGPGSPKALTALKSSDEMLQRVLAALDAHHVRENSDIFVVSDHGFSTISHLVDLRLILSEAGFAVTPRKTAPKDGDIMIVGNGGSALFYVIGQDKEITRRLVEFLEQSDFAGVIFTRDKLEGTFALGEGKIDYEKTPDVVMAFRWSEGKSQFGVPGLIQAYDNDRRLGEGTHASLSRFDMHNTLIVSGPDFRKGLTSELPSGNIDVAPTILHVLGITPPKMDGRVLSEALVAATNESPKPETRTVQSSRDFPAGTWRQTLSISQVGSTIYFDEGRGSFEPKR